MAQTEVDDAMTDPDYVDALQYIRTSVVTVNGRGVKQESAPIDFVGSVQAGGGDQLVRGGDAEYNTGSISIITKARLVAGSDTISADQVLWQGDRYTVVNVAPWTNYGQGYVKADCEIKTLRGSKVSP